MVVKGGKVGLILNAASLASVAIEMAKNPEVQEKAKDIAKKAWNNKDEIKEAVDAAAPVVRKAVKKGAAAGSKAADFVGDAASNVAKAAGNVTDSAAEAMKASAERRARQKELEEARQQLLQSATAKMKADDFEAEWEKAQQAGSMSPLKSPGYFVVAVYKNKPHDGKLYDYKDVFVSRSENMGASIHRHLTGEGNPDVYADMKYGCHMLVFAFPDFDFEDDNNETLCQFVTALRADVSYNARALRSVREASCASVEIAGSATRVVQVAHAFDGIVEGSFSIEHQELCGDGLEVCVLRLDDGV